MKKLPSWARLPVLRRSTRHNVFFASTRNTPTYAFGLNAFDPSQGNLLLPRLEWRRCGGKATLRLTLFSESSLQHDAIQAKEFIATLVVYQALAGLHLTTTREQHWPDKTGWTQLIELATKTIAEGELDKVVLARATDLHFASPVNAAAMMAASRRLNLNCYHFYMAFDGENAFWLFTGTVMAAA
ncbi:chorismate-binding protein [Escherichia coli]